MDKKDNVYIKADNNKLINEACIRWVQKFDECLEVCTKSTGCDVINGGSHRICKINNSDSDEIIQIIKNDKEILSATRIYKDENGKDLFETILGITCSV
jgi:hypothetical protein